MQEILSDITDIVNLFTSWVGSMEQYGQYWIMLYVLLPFCAWAVIVWVALWARHSRMVVVRVVANVAWWLWLVASSMVIGYVAAWLLYYMTTVMFWLELSGGQWVGWGHNWPLPLWIWPLFVSTIFAAAVVGLEQRKRPATAGLGIFWWIGASAHLSPDDNTLTDLPVVHKV